MSRVAHAEAEYLSASRIFKALGHPLRVKIVCGLLREPCTQTHISSSLGLPQSTVAQHLSVLRREGIVRGDRDRGAEVVLRVIDPRVPVLFRCMCDSDGLPELDWNQARASHSR